MDEVYVCDRVLKKKPLEFPEVLVPDLVSTFYYNLSLVISRSEGNYFCLCN
ncbi:hypothetical protein WKK05_29130 [Nostoc sp. UHCC 0302]|uniref:hypothetical protein n=1 Tax=Nostoc sp. UHCC 0302 TaxID=3134896 RepID=UPI00311CC19D